MATGAFNGRCSDAMTLPISHWLFHLKGETILPYCALQFLQFISIGMNHLCISIDFVVPTLCCQQISFSIEMKPFILNEVPLFKKITPVIFGSKMSRIDFNVTESL